MRAQVDVVCPSLVGRGAEMDRARQLLARARDGHAQVAFITGDAGVGKSRLLRATMDEARAAGFFVLHGASFEAEASIPYAPLLDLVRLFVGSASRAVVAHVLAPAAPELVAMFPELRHAFPDVTPASTVDPESDKRRLLRALSEAVSLLAATQPVLLAFEDAHWSDDATLDLIFHLARSAVAMPVVIALTYRADEAGARLGRLVADAHRAGMAVDLPVEPLGQGDVEDMLHAIFGARGALDGEFAHRLFELTEGNPFFVEETLKALITVGDLSASRGSWRVRPLERVRVPRTALEAVRRRLAALTVPARTVASTAAVAGRRFDFALLRTLTGMDEPELLAVVKELIAAQIVVEESAERFAFRHALTREAIYADLLARERVALHRAVASALERANAESIDTVVESLAYHTWEAGDWETSSQYATAAAEHALALSAPREAVTHLDRAVAASERAGKEVSARLWLRRGWANETLGEFQRAHEDFTRALERARGAGGNDDRSEWDATHALGMLWAARDYSRAGEYRRGALTVARRIGDGSLIARSLNRIGNWHVNLDEPHAGLPHHEEALAIFERLGDDTGVAETIDLIAMAHHCAGDEHAAASYYERSIELFTRLNDRRGLANALALLALSGPSHHASSTTPSSSNRAAAELRAPQSLRLSREIGWRVGEAAQRFMIADCLAWRGEFDKAIPLAREALVQAREIEHLQWTAGALRLLGVLSLDLFATSEARDLLEEAHQIAQRLGSHVWARWTAAPLAQARCRMSDIDGALDVLDRAARLTATGATPAGATLTLGERQLWLARAELALAQKKPRLALEITDARLAFERAANPGSNLGVPRLSLLRADALAALGRLDAAALALDVARTESAAQGARPLLWRIAAAEGHVHREKRRRADARRAFDAAQAGADELAASIPDEVLRQRFRDGVAAIVPAAPPPSANRAAKAEFGGLTRREREVAVLIAHGKSNRAIARELGLGERTVEGHVASALGKLGFASRTQLAAWAVEKGMLRPSAPRAAR